MIHKHPDECLQTLPFCQGDAGRKAYLGSEPMPDNAGDCPVIAVSYATQMSYADAVSSLSSVINQMEIWKLRLPEETWMKSKIRMFRRWIDENLNPGLPHHRNPVCGVHTDAYDRVLTRHGYRGGPLANAAAYFPCICDACWDFVVEGQVTDRGFHVATIVQGVVQGDVDITRGNFHVTSFWLRCRD